MSLDHKEHAPRLLSLDATEQSRMSCTQRSMLTFCLICSKGPDMWSASCYVAKCTSISSWCVYFLGLQSLSAIFILNRSCSHWPFRILHIYKGAFYKNILKCCMNIISFILIISLWGKIAHITLLHHHQTQCWNENRWSPTQRVFRGSE